jgi:hypothetical protein
MSKLKQAPLFLAPDLERALRALPPHLRARAERLRLHLVEHDSTWLHITWEAVQIQRSTLFEVLRGDHSRRAVHARHRAWTGIAGAGATEESIAEAFGMHGGSVKYGIARHREREALEAAAAAEVERFQLLVVAR